MPASRPALRGDATLGEWLGALVVRQARLLRAVASLSPLPVPVPAFVDPGAGCLAYARLPGVPLLVVPPPSGACADVRPAFTHGDLAIEHVLVAPASGAVTGIIHWSDAARTDPAVDFGRIERDLGAAAYVAKSRAALPALLPGDGPAPAPR